MNLSKSKIKNTGSVIRRSIREGHPIQEEDLERLQEYRVLHQEALQKVFNALAKISESHYKGSLTVYRLKRLDTIIRKLVRFPNMALSNMQDIAGCRAIVGSEGQIKKIVAEFERDTDFEILGKSDYLETPRETGYRSFHLMVKPIDCDKVVEVQLRTRANHHWATLVEITDLLFDVKLKEGETHPDLFDFHKLLSIEKSRLTIEEKERLIVLERKSKIISKIISVFKTNYYVAVDRWGRALPKSACKYVIMEIDENFSPNFEFFIDFESAESAYFSKFAQDEPNMVLIHVSSTDFEKIGLAYSNYVLTSHPSVKFFIEIIQSTILELLIQGDIAKAEDLYIYYDELIDEILATFEIEITSLRSKIDKEENFLEEIVNGDKYDQILEEWISNFRNRFDNLKSSHDTFLNQYEKEKINAKLTINDKAKVKSAGFVQRIINAITK